MERTQNSSSGVLIILVLLGIALAFVMFASAAQDLASFSFGQQAQGLTVKASDHAVSKHPEAAAINKCLDDTGPSMIMRNMFDRNTFYRVCQFEPGRWGFSADVIEKGQPVNKTSFSPGNGTLKEVMDYLNKIANRYTGPFPPKQ